jgi:hypothetical protein
MIGSGGEEAAGEGIGCSSAPASSSISENSALEVESAIAADSAYAIGGSQIELVSLNLNSVYK